MSYLCAGSGHVGEGRRPTPLMSAPAPRCVWVRGPWGVSPSFGWKVGGFRPGSGGVLRRYCPSRRPSTKCARIAPTTPPISDPPPCRPAPVFPLETAERSHCSIRLRTTFCSRPSPRPSFRAAAWPCTTRAASCPSNRASAGSKYTCISAPGFPSLSATRTLSVAPSGSTVTRKRPEPCIALPSRNGSYSTLRSAYVMSFT